jgi:hypothetical protein
MAKSKDKGEISQQVVPTPSDAYQVAMPFPEEYPMPSSDNYALYPGLPPLSANAGVNATPEQMRIRAFEKREEERSRYAIRPPVHAAQRTPLDIPPEWVPPGMDYMWVRFSIYNEPDYLRSDEVQLDTWQPVPASRHPQLASRDLLGRERETDGVVRRGSLILCERAKAMGDQARAAFADLNASLLQNMQGYEDYGRKPGIHAMDGYHRLSRGDQAVW